METVTLMDFILKNLEALDSEVDMIAPVKRQIWFIQEKLKLFRNFVMLGSKLIGGKKLNEFLVGIRTWANHISCLTCLYWTDEAAESLACTVGTALSDLMQKTMPYTPELIALHFDILKALRYQKFETVKMHQLAQLGARYVDFLLENLHTTMNIDIELLREGLIFLLAFIMDPSKDKSRLIWTQIDAIISEVPSIICLIHFGEMTVRISMSMAKLSEFLRKIDRLKAEVGRLYPLTTHLSQSNSPMTNSTGFLDFLTGNLKKILAVELNFTCFVRRHIEIVQEELSLLRPILKNIMEFRHLMTRIINMLYTADYAIKLSSVPDFPAWYGIICLSNVIEDIKHIKMEVNEFLQLHKLSENMDSRDALLPEATTSRLEGVFIGFEEDARSIMDHLIGGRKDLAIISISGMPGQGKTTLAKRIYNDPSIQYHFHKILWGYVSKECNTRELLIEMLSGIGDFGIEEILELDIQDLVDYLRKSLKGKKYLIVMDDIWDVNLWYKVQGSFPNDHNGSRIMFTSRNYNLASQAKRNSISHPLRLFSDEESWELIKMKLFPHDCCAPEFVEIGKQIASCCKGLPLAVVLIASLLGRTEQNLDLWNKVAENLKSHLANEGCMHIMELSYKYLPDHLKPCFLYFGVFSRGKCVSAKKLKLLWIAEGFINENEMQCSEDLANEYLDNLVCQNLVFMTERSSGGGIKTCNVHDLLYDLCLQKAMEENFIHLVDESTVVDQCHFISQKYNHHRLRVGKSDPFTKPIPICTRKELPSSPVQSILWSGNDSWSLLGSCFRFPTFFLEHCKVLTVLDLEEVHLLWHEIPEVIMSIIHLRYLSIEASYIVRIPRSIANLCNLQTLIVRKTMYEIELPRTMLKMKSLRYVNIYSCRLSFEDLELHDHLLYFEDLAKLCAPILSYDGKTEKFLRRLPRLRRLNCFLEGDFSVKWFSPFASLNQLESLRIRYVGHMFPNFESQKFMGIVFPENLKKLSLSDFKLPWRAMSTIGKMPNLEVLKLLCQACKGTEWELGDGDFPKLRYLKLCLLDIERLNASSESFPRLEELVVDHCWRLQEIPSSFGEVCTLKTIKVLQSHKASDSVARILEQQQYMENNSLQVVIK